MNLYKAKIKGPMDLYTEKKYCVANSIAQAGEILPNAKKIKLLQEDIPISNKKATVV